MKTLQLLSEQQFKVFEFAKLKHGTQVRKYTLNPYTDHLLNVVQILIDNDAVVFFEIEIALLHDILEDTFCTMNELVAFLISADYTVSDSYFITSRVKDLTDQYTLQKYPNLNRKKRKQMETLRLSCVSEVSQTVKYADLIDNSISICEHDKGFAKVYLQEKKELLRLMKEGNFDLYLQACAILYNNLNNL